MRKLIAVVMLVGGFLGMAGPAMAAGPAGQIGIGDPLTLAASGVLIPFFGAVGDVALLEVSSPAGPNLKLHMFFFDANCDRVGDSRFLPLTFNDYATLQIVGVNGVLNPSGFYGPLSPLNGGLISIATSRDQGFSQSPLENPIHSRMYLLNPNTAQSRIVEPIIIDAAEAPFTRDVLNPGAITPQHLWSPLRTAATFHAPQEGGLIKTQLFLICPKAQIAGAEFFAPSRFPEIAPPFPVSFSSNQFTGSLRAIIFDTNETPIVDTHTGCDCVRTVSNIAAAGAAGISTIYTSPLFSTGGSYTKIEASPTSSTGLFAFTGYRSTSTGPINDFFGRLSNGSYIAVDGANGVAPTDPPNLTPDQR